MKLNRNPQPLAENRVPALRSVRCYPRQRVFHAGRCGAHALHRVRRQLAVGLLTERRAAGRLRPGIRLRRRSGAHETDLEAVSYALSMSLAVAALWSFRRARGGVRPAIGLARRGFDGRLLLWGFVLILGLDTVARAARGIGCPAPPSTISGRGWGHTRCSHWWSSPRCSRRRSAAAWCSGRCTRQSTGSNRGVVLLVALFRRAAPLPAQAINTPR